VEVESALDRMAGAISKQLADTNPILMCVMQGGLIVTGKLAARLPFVLQLDYLHATRYRDQTSGADLQWKSRPTLDLQNRIVVLVDDILDEGETLFQVRKFCLDQGSAEVYCAVLSINSTTESPHRSRRILSDCRLPTITCLATGWTTRDICGTLPVFLLLTMPIYKLSSLDFNQSR